MCHEQNIECETEYFGLVINSRRTRSNSNSDHNNVIAQSIDLQDVSHSSSSSTSTSSSSASPAAVEPIIVTEEPKVRQWLNLRNPLGRRSDTSFLSLSLRVKFWVPVHLILQESVRNLFFMEARQELLENRIFALDFQNAIKLAALMAHADGVRFNAGCLEENARLKVTTSNNNSRLMIVDPYQRRRGSKRKSSEPTTITSLETSIKPTPLSPLNVYEPYLSVVRPMNTTQLLLSKERLLLAIAEEHQKYADQLPKSAQYWFLTEFGNLKGFGVEKFIVPKVEGLTSSQVELAVGPEGLGVLLNRGDERIE